MSLLPDMAAAAHRKVDCCEEMRLSRQALALFRLIGLALPLVSLGPMAAVPATYMHAGSP